METLEREKQFSREVRVQNDIETLFAECLDGSMRTPFEYTYNPDLNKLFADDGSDIDQIFDKSIENTKKLVEKNPNLGFELRRQKIESEERDEMKAMMRGELPNVIIVVSDFPEELTDYPSDYHGYNVSRKQTMLRVLMKKDEKLQMFSQSLDGSNRHALEAIYKYFGFSPEPGELLGQRIHVDIDEDRRSSLVDELTSVYDQDLESQFGRKYYSGIEIKDESEIINTYDFVKSQKDLVGLAVAEVLNFDFNEEKQYQTIAALQNRLNEYKKPKAIAPVITTPQDSGSYVAQVYRVQQERIIAGTIARSEGKTFSGCGVTMKSHNMSPEESLTTLGFTGIEEKKVEKDKEENWSYDKQAYCVSCQAPPKKDEGKKMCGPCNICKECVDTKYGGKK